MEGRKKGRDGGMEEELGLKAKVLHRPTWRKEEGWGGSL